MGLGHLLEQFGKAAVSGIPGTAQRYEADQADRKATADEMAWGNHLQEIGAKPIFHGLVREDVTAPDGSTAPVYRAPDPNRIKTTQKTKDGKVEWEVPSPEEQATRRIKMGLDQLHQQFRGEADVRAQQDAEAATKAGGVATATGRAQLGVTNENRQQNGIEAPAPLQRQFANIFTEPAAPPAATSAAGLPPTPSSQPAAAPAGVGPSAELRRPRKFLPAELDPLMAGLANSENVGATVDAKQQQKAVQQLSSVTDQAGYDAVRTANPEASATWPKIYSAPIQASLIRQNVNVKDQPDYDIKTLTLKAMDAMSHDPGAIDKEIDGVIPPAGDTAALNNRTKLMVRSRMAQGDLKGARDLIKDASDQVGRTETAVSTARATAPIKINIAAAEAAARGESSLKVSGLTEDDLAREGRQLAITGESAQLGNGSGAVKGRILHYKNEFARQSGLTAADMAVAKAAYKGNAKSLAAMVTQRDQIGSFEQTARKNLDTFIDAASKIPDTGIPWLNTPIRQLNASIVGSANMAAVNAAREVANNEIAKVTSGGGLGGVLSDAARKEVQSYNPANATFAQTKAVAAILKKDMATRMQSFNDTIGDIEKRIAAPSGSAATPTEAPAPAPAAGAGRGATTRQVGQTVTLKDGTTAKISKILPNGKYEVE